MEAAWTQSTLSKWAEAPHDWQNKERTVIETWYGLILWPRSETPYLAVTPTNPMQPVLFSTRKAAVDYGQRECAAAQRKVIKIEIVVKEQVSAVLGS